MLSLQCATLSSFKKNKEKFWNVVLTSGWMGTWKTWLRKIFGALPKLFLLLCGRLGIFMSSMNQISRIPSYNYFLEIWVSIFSIFPLFINKLIFLLFAIVSVGLAFLGMLYILFYCHLKKVCLYKLSHLLIGISSRLTRLFQSFQNIVEEYIRFKSDIYTNNPS